MPIRCCWRRPCHAAAAGHETYLTGRDHAACPAGASTGEPSRASGQARCRDVVRRTAVVGDDRFWITGGPAVRPPDRRVPRSRHEPGASGESSASWRRSRPGQAIARAVSCRSLCCRRSASTAGGGRLRCPACAPGVASPRDTAELRPASSPSRPDRKPAPHSSRLAAGVFACYRAYLEREAVQRALVGIGEAPPVTDPASTGSRSTWETPWRPTPGCWAG